MLFNESLTAAWGLDNGPEESFHESLTWAEKCWSLAVPILLSPPSYRPWFVLNSHKLTLAPLPKINSYIKSKGQFFILMIRFCPLHVDTMNCTLPLSSWGFVFPFSRKAHEPKAWKVASAGGGLGKCGGRGLGALIFLQGKRVGQPSRHPQDYQENCRQCSNYENGGVVGYPLFFKKAVFLVSDGLRLVWLQKRDMWRKLTNESTYLPCEENLTIKTEARLWGIEGSDHFGSGTWSFCVWGGGGWGGPWRFHQPWET